MVAVKTAIVKDTLREFWRTKSRFFSIFAIVAIGVGFFAGLKATCPDMLHTADAYFAESNLFDVHLISTIGFNSDDLAAVKHVKNVGEVMPAYSLDALVNAGGSNMVVKVHSIPLNAQTGLNRPTVVEGRLPLKKGECVVDAQQTAAVGYELGEQVTLFADAKQDDISEMLGTDAYTVVGKVRTPYYITLKRGSTSIGNGTIESFVMVPEDDFILEVYTDLYVNAKGKEIVSSFAPEYDILAGELSAALKTAGENRAETRYNEIRGEALGKINDAKQELADGEETQRTELADARGKIDDGKAELADGIKTLAEKEQEYRDKIADGEAELADARETIAEATEDFRYGYEKYRKERNEALKQLGEAEEQLETLRGSIPQLLQAADAYQLLMGVEALFPAPDDPAAYPAPDALRGYAAFLAQAPQFEALARGLNQLADAQEAGAEPALLQLMVKSLLSQVNGAKKALDEQTGGKFDLATTTEASLNELAARAERQIESGYEELAEAGKTIAEAQKELEKGRTALADAEIEFEDGKTEGLQKINEAKRDIADAQVKIADAEVEYADGERDSNKEIADARVKIADAEAELADFEQPKWYVQDRGDLPGFSGYGDDAERIDAISQVFPVFFLLVAALVCLTTMTRMVEEQRTQIGTVKALGYGNFTIISKYLVYALAATLTGSAVGLAVGFQLFPRVIYNAYGIMYTMPPLLSPFNWGYALTATGAAVLVTVITVVSASYKELSAVPAALMRPKAPKNGKRVFLERLPFLWNRLGFTQKVTMRNLLRYKKRMLMTVIGIAGCTALVLTGFGVKDSISNIVTKQFGDIFKYDMLAVLNSDLSEAEKAATAQLTRQNALVKNSVLLLQKSSTAKLGEKQVEGSLFVPADTQALGEFVSLRDRVGGTPLALTGDGAVISEKTALLLGAKVGDSLTFTDSDSNEFQVPLTGIAENYAGHYFYFSPALYERLTGAAPSYNTLLALLDDPTPENRDAVSQQLLQSDNVIMTSFTAETRDTFGDVMKSLDYVVLVLILSAGALAFVVLYNLTNINITERIREIATIKVLGFYDKEVSAYIYRENILLTIMGMLAGLGGGVLLHRFVIITAEVDMVMFGRNISPISFVFAGAITLLFALVVNWVMYYKLKKVSMVESLKSVE